MSEKLNYGTAILSAFHYLLDKYPEVFVIGQGLWSPWYVGSTMTNLEKDYGKHRVIDTPVSESACTGAAVGAALSGMRPIVVHPRMDFMLYAMDSIVNQAAKWSSMTGGQSSVPVTVRAIINRGGEQGAQHSQALHSWFAHVPGLRVVMPASVADARDLFIASVLSDDPVMFIDDRWLYEQEDTLDPIQEISLSKQAPIVLKQGTDLTIVASGYSTLLALKSAEILEAQNYSIEVIDQRIINPVSIENTLNSVSKTKNLLVIDSGTKTGSFSAEIIANVIENISINLLDSLPKRITLPDAPAPTSRVLESNYYFTEEDITLFVKKLLS